jgi:hypothetical protein
MTPVVAWGVTSQGSALSSVDAVPVAPTAGDLVFVSITAVNESGGAPTVTPASGWEIVDNQTFSIYGAYPARNVLMKKVIGSSEASNLGATFTTNANLSTQTDAWGIRGADPASVAISITSNTTDSNLMWGSVATTSGALILRLATNHSARAGYWGNVGPSGHTRLSNKKSVEPNTALYYATATGATTGTAGPSPLDTGGNVAPTFSYTISLADSSGPDVTAPTITSSASPSVAEGSALSHSLTANEAVTWTKISGDDFTLTGSTLSLASQTYPSGPFVAVVRATDSAGNWSEQTITVSITEAPLASYIGSAGGTTTLNLPTHQADDLLVAFLFRDGSTTAPVTPSGWNSAATGTSTTCSYRLVWKKATTSAESAGGSTTATSTITSCYRPKPGYTLSFGAASQGNGSGTSLTYQSLTMQAASSLLGAFAGHRSVNTALENPPTGMVLRHNVVDATDEASAFDTNGFVSSWTAKTVSVGGTSSGWITTVYEIKAAATVSGRRRSVWISLID